MEQHGYEEKEEEGDAVEDEDVGNVRDVGGSEECHLLFSSAHKEEAGCIKELGGQLAHVHRRKKGPRTKGVRYWKLFVSSLSVSEIEFWSLSTNEISTILAAPAAMRV